MSANDWNESKIEQLRNLWADGHSSAEIGRRIGMTKNAVIGKARRIGLPNRESPIALTTPWSSEEDAIVESSAQEGMDDDQIAILLPTRTRQAIQARRYTLGVLLTHETRARQKLAGSAGRKNKCTRRRKPSQVRLAFFHDSEPKPPQIVYPISPADLHCETVRNDNRAPDGCRWLVNDRSPWLACAAKRMSGESYCPAHAARSSKYPDQEQAA